MFYLYHIYLKFLSASYKYRGISDYAYLFILILFDVIVSWTVCWTIILMRINFNIIMKGFQMSYIISEEFPYNSLKSCVPY